MRFNPEIMGRKKSTRCKKETCVNDLNEYLKNLFQLCTFIQLQMYSFSPKFIL